MLIKVVLESLFGISLFNLIDCQLIFFLCCLLQVLLCFSRDTSVLEHFAYSSATPPKSYIRGNRSCFKKEYSMFIPFVFITPGELHLKEY